ncbi:MAG: 2-dehydropantoate 2-reductase [Acidobacteria bacterium]|nr:2-dehydropantoate 2-reductase [Acidobacteriota bacterium]
MKIAVMGSGGLGGYYGALLGKLGEEVTFIARGAHLAALRSGGMRIRSINGDFTIAPVRATDIPSEIGVVDMVLFAVKTYDTDEAARAIQPIVGPATTVLTFQNGVESHERIDDVVGQGRALPAPTQIASTVVEPGVISQESQFRNTVIGEVRGGISRRVDEIVALLAKTGVSVTAAENGLTPVWHKLVFLSSIAGLTACARTPAHDLFLLPAARETLRLAMQEVYDVGRACGVPMDPDIVDRQHSFALGMKPGIRASMHVDLERGRRLEIDALSGAVVRLGSQHRVATPVHQTLYAALKPWAKS